MPTAVSEKRQKITSRVVHDLATKVGETLANILTRLRPGATARPGFDRGRTRISDCGYVSGRSRQPPRARDLPVAARDGCRLVPRPHRREVRCCIRVGDKLWRVLR